MKRLFLSLLIFSAFLDNAAGGHILGGELNYRCLGDDQYEITLDIYRDCSQGNAWFDDPAIIGIYDSNDEIIYTLGSAGYVRIPFQDDDTIFQYSEDICLELNFGKCIHTTKYTDTVSLPFRTGGYYLAYYVCCRQRSNNYYGGGNTVGGTYTIRITEDALLLCNSSPSFKKWPLLVHCVNKPIEEDQSAVDIDGDSLVYRLCTPLGDGISSNEERPPYKLIEWVDPPFSLDNLLGGNVPLSIDPITGLLTAIPESLGNFTIGICIEEYREGVLLSTSIRDFQFNIVNCRNKVRASFYTEEFCANDTLPIENSSRGGDSFFWQLNAPGYTDSVLTDSIPVIHSLPPGSYPLKLIVKNNSGCIDSVEKNIVVKDTVEINFSYQKECGSLQVQFNGISNSIIWRWDFGDGQTSMQKDPLHFYDSDGIYTVTISALDRCRSSSNKTITVEKIITNLQDTLTVCAKQPIELNPGGNPNYTYNWSPAEFLDDATIANPTAIVDETTLFTVDIVGDLDTCTLTKEVLVIVEDLFILTSDDSLICEGDTVKLTASPQTGRDVSWDWEPKDVIITDPTMNMVRAVVDETTTFIVTATTPNGCIQTDSITIVVEQLDPNVMAIADPPTIEFGEDGRLDVIGGLDEWMYTWRPGEGLMDSTDKSPLVLDPRDTTNYTVTIKTDNGCLFELSTTLNVIQPPCERPYIFLPNAFSPNNDGQNDVLYVRGEFIDQMELLIYNRLGEQVFRSTNKDIGWDGLTNGEENTPAAFGYYLMVTCEGGGTLTEKGSVSIIK